MRLTLFQLYEMPTFDSFLKLKTMLFELNVFNIIVLTFFYLKNIYKNYKK